MIDYIAPQVAKTLPYWSQIDDAINGSVAVKRESTKYLPKENQETQSSYDARLKKGTYLDYYNPTIDGISGLIFKNGIKYNDNIPSQLSAFIKNANMQGDHFDIIIKELFEDALNKGISFAMIDMPMIEEIKNKKQETQLGIKPYVVQISPENVTAWKTKTVNGQIVLDMVKIREFAEVEDVKNIYATKTVTRYRVLRVGYWELWEEEELIATGATKLDVIPFIGLNLNKKGFFAAFPTFYELFELNVHHYQVFSDIRHNNHISCIPMLKFIGFDSEEVKKIPISANTAIATTNTEASVEWLDYDGNGAATSERTLERLETKMREIGLSVISQDKAVTATEINISSAQSQSKLNGYVRSLVDSVELILLMASKFYGLNDGGSIDIDADILTQPLTSQDVAVLSTMATSGTISIEQMWSMIQSGTFRVDSDFSIELEKERIANDGLLSNDTQGTAV